MAYSYDELDTPPAGMIQIGQTNGSLTRPLYSTGKRIICHADTKKQLPSYRYCAANHYPNVPIDTRNLYNPFTLWFGTDSTVNGQVIGTLHFSFSVLLLDPIFLEANTTALSVVEPTAVHPCGTFEKELMHKELHPAFCKDTDCSYHSRS